ncbi:MAG TPA: hypothetical protein VJU86_11465 [Pyrinomonadaceae bacterium]|nr:hypothetical protein [Pyrinomonadaceae bacterium]
MLRLRVLDAHTPVLFYSGAAYDHDKKRAIEAGANAYVTKPDIEGLLARVKELVSMTNCVVA